MTREPPLASKPSRRRNTPELELPSRHWFTVVGCHSGSREPFIGVVRAESSGQAELLVDDGIIVAGVLEGQLTPENHGHITFGDPAALKFSEDESEPGWTVVGFYLDNQQRWSEHIHAARFQDAVAVVYRRTGETAFPWACAVFAGKHLCVDVYANDEGWAVARAALTDAQRAQMLA